MNPDEKAHCPFNENHTFAKQKLLFHLNRCKDKEKMMPFYAVCPYNPLHFVLKQELETHELICVDKAQHREMRAKLRATFLRSQRERSRDKTKKEDDEKTYKKDEGSDEEDEMVLSDCEECQEIIKRLALAGKSHDKLNKYLQKYAQVRGKKTLGLQLDKDMS